MGGFGVVRRGMTCLGARAEQQIPHPPGKGGGIRNDTAFFFGTVKCKTAAEYKTVLCAVVDFGFR
jgi:hypothetical protein